MRVEISQEADGHWTITDHHDGAVMRTGLRSRLEAIAICDRRRWIRTDAPAPTPGPTLVERAERAGLFAADPAAL
jgi:hypothetical protein